MEHLFSPNSSGRLRSDAHQSQIIEGDADVDHTHTIEEILSNYSGRYIPHPPRVSASLQPVVGVHVRPGGPDCSIQTQ